MYRVYKLPNTARIYVYPWECSIRLCDVAIKTLYKTCTSLHAAKHYMQRDIVTHLGMRYYDIDIDPNDIEILGSKIHVETI